MPTNTILLAFANDWVDGKRHLRSLLEESKAIGKVLAPLVDAGVLGLPPPIHNVTVDDVIGAFREHRYRDRICIFHFGGHASGSKLMFEDEDGARTEVHAHGLSGYLGRQRGLVLVFLNGCSTEPQVRRLRAAGVKAVVATTSAIQDTIAAEFATAFYAELTTRSLRDAFETAVQAIRLRWGDDPRAVLRDVESHEEPETDRWPWIIDCDPDHEAWTLSSEREPKPSWGRRLAFAAASIPLLLLTSLIISGEARRTTCRVSGLRSLCAGIGIGDVPTTAEQTLWDDALRQDSDNGLNTYLNRHPRGVYADEAKSRLAGCQTKESSGAEKEFRFPQTVPRARPWHTETEARRDALERGDREADTMCKSLEETDRLLSAQAEPRSWVCEKTAGVFTCLFHGEIVCRVQKRIKSKHCRPQ